MSPGRFAAVLHSNGDLESAYPGKEFDRYLPDSKIRRLLGAVHPKPFRPPGGRKKLLKLCHGPQVLEIMISGPPGYF